ncbi:MAG: competence/damage-inducible protein A [Cytophagales bacterium]|nr:competence/damage-inducible protein A [Cytophagales bacterium]
MPTKAEIITIGDEILYGQTLDTNSHWMSGALDEINIKVYQKTTIGDTEEHILASLKEAEARADVILITGGLGPTNDDLTKPVLAKYFGVELIRNEEALQEIKDLFYRAGREMSVMNERQADLPANCRKITNHVGTAPGMWFEVRGKIFISMPGVPYEMKEMMERNLLPMLRVKFTKEVIHHRVIKTLGVPESTLAEQIKDWEANLPSHQKLAYLPTFGQVKLRLTSTGTNLDTLKKEAQAQIDKVLPLIKKHVFGFDKDELEQVLGDKLKAQNATIAVAESCTGGQIAAAFTSVPGSSAYFKGGVVAYDNQVKIDQLAVDPASIETHGAVSEEVVKQMAENVRKLLTTDVGLATSGIAGPGGGTPEKPVGTIWLAYADKDKTIARKVQFTRNRQMNVKFGVMSALNLFRMNFNA